MGRDVVLVSSADETAFAVRDLLTHAADAGRRLLRVTRGTYFSPPGASILSRRLACVSSVPRWQPSSPGSGADRGTDRVGMFGVVRRRRRCGVQWLSAASAATPRSGSTAATARSATCRSTSPPRTSRAVVLTHGHPDHCVDIYGLHVLLRYGLGRENVPIYAPEGLEKFLLSLVSDWGNTFDWRRGRRRRRRRRSATSTSGSPGPTTRRPPMRSRPRTKAGA